MKRILTILTAMLLSLSTVSAQPFQFNECEMTSTQTIFRLVAPPNAKRVLVRIYQDGEGGRPIRTVKMKYSDGLWTGVVNHSPKKTLKGKFYTFDVSGDKIHWQETPGIFAKAVGVNGRRAAIIDLRDTDPFGWDRDQRPPLKSPADLVIYEMHHRDFSVARNVNLNPGEVIMRRTTTRYPGKFLALMEQWAVGHLKALGVNAVHILPSFDFASIDEADTRPQYNWGYDPLNYNVPEGSYSTDPRDPATRIREFKTMVQALHKAGIRVILDVVYNHTYDLKRSNFQLTWPDYYYRKTADGNYSNGSGCGNETASEQPLMRAYMIESVKYWINEYHIDGFRFDLMGVHDIETMNAIRKAVDQIDPSIFIYGEGWSAGDCAYPSDRLGMKANIPQMPRIAAFSDEIRDALRGPFSDDTKGAFLAGKPGEEESLKFGIAGCIAHPQVNMDRVNYSKVPWATQPTQMISYVSCHDDMCLVDRLKTSIPGIPMERLIRLDLLAQTAVFTSQGIPFILSGEELLRDKKGVHNSFESPDSINQLNWNNLERYPEVFDYYQRLIHLRKNHPAFRIGDAEKVRQSLDFLTTQPCLVAFRLKGHAGGDPWEDIIVVLNANAEAKTVEVPAGKYTVVCQDGKIDEQGLGIVDGPTVKVAPQSAMILYR